MSRGTSLFCPDLDNLGSYEMVQPYGATEYSCVDVEARDDTASEDTSLLGAASIGKKRTKREGHATIVSGIGNLANTIVGSGERYVSSAFRPLLTQVAVGMLTFPLVLLPFLTRGPSVFTLIRLSLPLVSSLACSPVCFLEELPHSDCICCHGQPPRPLIDGRRSSP